MECWVLKYGKKGVWSSFLKEFLEIFKNEDFEAFFRVNLTFSFIVDQI